MIALLIGWSLILLIGFSATNALMLRSWLAAVASLVLTFLLGVLFEAIGSFPVTC